MAEQIRLRGYSEEKMRAHTDTEYEAAVNARIPIVTQHIIDSNPDLKPGTKEFGQLLWDGMRSDCVDCGIRRW